MVQGHVAPFEDKVHRILFTIRRQLLPTRRYRERVSVIVEMGKLALAVGGRDDTDTAALRPRGRQRHPGGDVLERCQSEIGRVLVPGDVVSLRGGFSQTVV